MARKGKGEGKVRVEKKGRKSGQGGKGEIREKEREVPNSHFWLRN